MTYEQAQRLKNAGFNWPTGQSYVNRYEDGLGTERIILFPSTPNWPDMVRAPEISLALKWMRDVKGLQCGVDPAPWGERAEDDTPRYCGHWIERVSELDAYTSYSDTYEAAESALLDELLNIIETDGINKKD